MNNPKEELLEKIAILETQLNDLIQSLARGNYPLELAKTVRITGALEIPKIVKIDISTAKLVEIYNDCPQLLANNAIAVNLTPQSYRQQISEKIVLEHAKNGNYWVIVTADNHHCLLPNLKSNFNIYKLKTVKKLFDIPTVPSTNNHQFILQQPAKLTLLPDGKQWQLKQPGIIKFVKKNFCQTKSQPELEAEIKQLKSQLQIAEHERKQMRFALKQISLRLDIEQVFNHNNQDQT